MRQIRVADETLCFDTELSFKEKLELLNALDQMGVSSIELPAPCKKQDVLLYKAAAAVVQSAALSARVPLTLEGVDETWAAVEGAKRKRLCVSVPLSPAQLEYQCHKKPAAVPEMVKALVERCVQKGADVIFTAGDATRAQPAVLKSAVQAALDAGAGTIVFYDNAGQTLPEEFSCFVKTMFDELPALKTAAVGVSCADELSLSLPSVLEALKAGASEAVTAVGKNAHPSPEALHRVIEKRAGALGLCSPLNAGKLSSLSEKITALLCAPRSSTTSTPASWGGPGSASPATSRSRPTP